MSQVPVPIPPPAQPEDWPETLLVRYGRGNMVGQFRNAPGLKPLCGSKVIVLTDRGMEIGEVISLACPNCARAIPQDRIHRYVRASGPENCLLNAGKVLRLAERTDVDEAFHIDRSAIEMKRFCQSKADAMGLPMRVVGVEHVFGGERAIFYFQSESRIDFRGLVKDLAHEYQTRIEMRQIGARDEARLLADYEICGRECCCKNFLKNLKPVNMRMAKVQKATLDPTKVSGRCGRLRCCLRYENDNYEQLDRNLPPNNTRVRTEQGIGRVIDRQIITQLVVLIMEPDGPRVAVPVDAILERNVKTPAVASPGEQANGDDRRDRRRGREQRREDPNRHPHRLADEAGPGTGGDGASADSSGIAAADSSGDQVPPERQDDVAAAGEAEAADGGEQSAPRDGKRRRRRRRRRPRNPNGQQQQGQQPQGQQPQPGGNGE